MDIAGLFDIRGKTALVTGGSGGIGYMIAEGLAAAGCKVFICSRKADSIAAAAERLRAQVGAGSGEVIGFAADLATPEGIAAAAERVSAAGPLHILVNNAGAAWGAPIDRFPRAGFEKVLQLNLTAPFELTRALLPALEAAATRQDPARVINIASVDGMRPPIWETYSYSASKAGLIMMTRHMGKFLSGRDISVNAISPGFFRSKMTTGVVDFDDPDQLATIASPLGARQGTTEDIAGAVIYLCSRAGAWITGAMIPVSGGLATVE